MASGKLLANIGGIATRINPTYDDSTDILAIGASAGLDMSAAASVDYLAGSIKDTDIDFGTGTGQVNASDLPADFAAPANYTPTSADVKGHLDGIDTAIGNVVAGLIFKGPVFSKYQFVTGSGITGTAIKQGQTVAFTLGQPANNDTFTIYDGTTTRTYTAKTSGAGANEFNIGATISATVQNLAAAIEADGSKIVRAQASNFPELDNTNNVLVLSAISTLTTFRTWATIAAGGAIWTNQPTYINIFNGTSDDDAALDYQDPTTSNFSAVIDQSALNEGDTYVSRSCGCWERWDGTDDEWVTIMVSPSQQYVGGTGITIDTTTEPDSIKFDQTANLATLSGGWTFVSGGSLDFATSGDDDALRIPVGAGAPAATTLNGAIYLDTTNDVLYTYGDQWIPYVNASLAQTITGLKTFNPDSGTTPFAVGATMTGVVTNLNADLLDGQQGPYYTNIANLSITSQTTGDILLYNSGWTRLGVGTAGQLLQVSGGLPSWQTVTASVSLQNAYETGNAIVLDDGQGDFDITLDETGTFADFYVHGATGDYILTDAENASLYLGSSGAVGTYVLGTLDVEDATTLDQTEIDTTDGNLTVIGTGDMEFTAVDMNFDPTGDADFAMDSGKTFQVHINATGGSIRFDLGAENPTIFNATGTAITIGDGAIFDVTVNGDDIALSGSSGVTINASGGPITIGGDADAQAIEIGTGAAARTITIGNNQSATAINIQSGTTGGINLNDGVAQMDLTNGALMETDLASANITPSGTLTLQGGGVSIFGSSTGYFTMTAGALTSTGFTTTSIDGSGTMTLGGTGAPAVNISRAGVMTTILGTLNVDQPTTLDDTLGVTGKATFSGGANFPDTKTLTIGTGDVLTVVHNGADTTFTNITGNLQFSNTSVTGYTSIKTGTDTIATDFRVTNTSDTLFKISGTGKADFSIPKADGAFLVTDSDGNEWVRINSNLAPTMTLGSADVDNQLNIPGDGDVMLGSTVVGTETPKKLYIGLSRIGQFGTETYVQNTAAGAITAGDPVKITALWGVAGLPGLLSPTDIVNGVATTSIAPAGYGWVMLLGGGIAQVKSDSVLGLVAGELAYAYPSGGVVKASEVDAAKAIQIVGVTMAAESGGFVYVNLTAPNVVV